MSAVALARLVLRPGRAGMSVPARLPVAVFALVTLVALVAASWIRVGLSVRLPEAIASALAVFPAGEAALLVVPLGGLAAAAARLSSRRRDDQLSALRLLGATSATTSGLALIESVALAAVGAAIGVVAYVALLPVMGLVPSGGDAVGVGSIALPFPLAAAIVLAIIAIALVSTASSLRSVTVSPLGVLARQQPRGAHWIRLAAAIGMLVAVVMASNATGAITDGMMIPVIIAIVVVAHSVMNVAGPFLLSVSARIRLATAWTPRRLLSARGTLESPSIEWRSVSAVAATILVALGVVVGLGMLAQGDASYPDGPVAMWIDDFRAGLIATFAAATVLATCSIAVAQVADVLDRGEVYRAFRLMGMPIATMHRARALSVRSASRAAAIGAGVVGVVVMSSIPEFDVQFTEPLVLLVLASTVVANLLLVDIGLLVSRGTMRRLVAIDGDDPVPRPALAE